MIIVNVLLKNKKIVLGGIVDFRYILYGYWLVTCFFRLYRWGRLVDSSI